MRRLILFMLSLVVLAGCGGGGDLAAPAGSVITLTPSSSGGNIEITSTSSVQKSVVQIYQVLVRESDLAGAKGLRDTIFNVTFELTNVPGTATADLTSLVTLCDGSRVINATAEKQTDNQGVYNLCVVFRTGGGLNYTGSLRVLSGAESASTTIDIKSSLPALEVNPPTLDVRAGSRGQFTISGGSPEYAITSSNPAVLPVPSVVRDAGGAFVVTIPPGTPLDTKIDFTVRDAAGATSLVSITVKDPQPPVVLPLNPAVVAGGTVRFTIIGGVPDYSIFSGAAGVTVTPDIVIANGGTFDVTVPANTTATSVGVTVRDSIGGTVSFDIAVQAPRQLVVTPSSISVTAGRTATFAVSGGVPGYTIVSDNASAQPFPARIAGSGDTFLVTVPSTMPDTTVNLTVIDSTGQTAAATLRIDALPAQLQISPASVNIVPTAQQTVTFSLSGGTGPYTVTSDRPADVYFGTPGNGILSTTGTATATVRAGAPAGTVTIRAIDAAGSQRTAAIVIQTLPQLLLVPNAVTVLSATGGSLSFTISGGLVPYTVTSSSPADLFFGTAGTGLLNNAPSPFIATVPAGAAAGTVTLTVADGFGHSSSATVSIQ